MQLIKKNRILSDNVIKTDIFFCGLKVCSKKKTFFTRSVNIFGIPFISYNYRHKLYKKEKLFDNSIHFIDYIQKNILKSSKKNILWMDHTIGGGTDTYSLNQFSELKDKNTIIRLQYDPYYKYYIFSIPDKAVEYTEDFNEVKNILQSVVFSEICVNNLVSWFDIQKMLALLKAMKKTNEKLKISYRGHDFHSLCPSFNLLNCENEYCALSYITGCENCIKKVHMCEDELLNKVLFYGIKPIAEWRKMWAEFFSFADEVIVFSNSTKEIFLQVYPMLNQKIKIIPHKTRSLAKAAIKKHKGINIAVLGSINSVGKGRFVIEEMCRSNSAPDIQFFVIGTFVDPPENLMVTGRYTPENLPERMEKYQIDVVFISSVWPETFSYTTSEAMSMGMPVVCYDFGAPAERVKNYEKGLVLKKIDPVYNLSEIKNFVEKLRIEQDESISG